MDFPHGTADPMVRILVGEFRVSQTSRIIPDTLNPDLDAKFAFVVNPDVSKLPSLAQKVLAVEAGDQQALLASLGDLIANVESPCFVVK